MALYLKRIKDNEKGTYKMTSLKAFKESLHAGDKVQVSNYMKALWDKSINEQRIILAVKSRTIETGQAITETEAQAMQADNWQLDPNKLNGQWYKAIRLELQPVQTMTITDNSISLLAYDCTDHGASVRVPSLDFESSQIWFTMERVVD